MGILFAETLKKLRIKKGLSQRELASRIYVTRSAVSQWENSSRLPDAAMILRIAACLDADSSALLNAAALADETPNVIMVDDRELILSNSLPVIRRVIPTAAVTGFTSPSEAVEFAKNNPVALAFVDIELGKMSGLDLCRTLLDIDPRTNVVYLTAYIEYSFDAWNTGACGFMLKPITPQGISEQLKKLRYPFLTGDTAV